MKLPPGFERLLRSGGMFYRDGSGALGLCYVAAGRLDRETVRAVAADHHLGSRQLAFFHSVQW